MTAKNTPCPSPTPLFRMRRPPRIEEQQLDAKTRTHRQKVEPDVETAAGPNDRVHPIIRHFLDGRPPFGAITWATYQDRQRRNVATTAKRNTGSPCMEESLQSRIIRQCWKMKFQ